VLIDAHVHFWRLGRNGQVWPTPDLAAIHRDFLPDDLWVVGEPLGRSGVVAVQSQPNELDTDWLMTLADGDERIRGVVGWTDLRAPDAAGRIAELAAHPRLKGLRAMLQDLERDDWILDPGFSSALDAMASHGLTLDALVRVRHLPHILAFARARSDIPLVIDHAAKPDIAGGGFEAWSAALEAFADVPHVHCKLSGLLTEAGIDQPTSVTDRYIQRIFEVFPTSRIMWGSDWPVLNLSGDYQAWREQVRSVCPVHAEADVFGGVAKRFYGLEG
jgi:L-fuconolactonase